MKSSGFLSRIRGMASAFSQSNIPTSLQTSKTTALSLEVSGIRNLTPKKLAGILADADNGNITAQHLLFADVEDTDEHIFAELAKRRRALLCLDWSILPAPVIDKRQTNDAQRMAETVRGLFDAIPGFENMILGLADAIGHGFAALEIEWGYDGQYHIPVALHQRPQHWFCLDAKTHELRLRKGEGGLEEGSPLLPLGWMLHYHSGKSGWFARHGLFRVIMAAYLLKTYARTGFAEFLEIHGLPLRMGKFPNWASDAEKNALLRGLRSLGRDAAAIIPEGMEVTFVEAVRASEAPFTAMIDHCERGISKAILGGTLTSQADGKSSTHALGKVHNEIRRDLLLSDAVQIASTITQQLLHPLAVLNCGLKDAKLTPYFRFDTSEQADIQGLATALPKLATVMRIPAAWAHERCHIPLPEKDEAVLEAK